MLATTLLAALLPFVAASPFVARQNGVNADALKTVAAAKNRYFGTAYQSFYLNDPRFEPILNGEFDQYTPENEMKWEVVQPQRGVFNWTGADLIFEQAAKTGSIVRGHTLVWHSQLPTWVMNITDATDLKNVMKTHIDAVMGRYGSRLAHIDVVNEPLNENGTFRNSVWYNVLGEDFIPLAFQYAHAAAPNVKLFLNDYNIESVNNKSMVHAQLAKKLLASNISLAGVGFQCHFIGNTVPKDLAASMKMFTDQGLEVPFTELDVRVPVNNRGIANSTWLDIQAKDYASVTQTCLDNKLCPGITLWGFGDETSWVPGVFAGQGAATIKDFDYKPKSAYYSIQSTLKK